MAKQAKRRRYRRRRKNANPGRIERLEYRVMQIAEQEGFGGLSHRESRLMMFAYLSGASDSIRDASVSIGRLTKRV